MRQSRTRAPRFLTDSLPKNEFGFQPLSNFYREELLKCKRCLDQQREYYSEDAISEAERALMKVMSDLDRLCLHDDADRVISRLLQQFDVVTGLSARTDPRQVN